MSDETKLTLTLRDVYGRRLQGKVDIRLIHQRVQSRSRVVRNVDASKRITILGLSDGSYRISIEPTLYRMVRQFIVINEGENNKAEFILPFKPEKVVGIHSPAFTDLREDLQQVLENSAVESYPDIHGEELYQALDDIRKAGLLNIYHKMRLTTFQNGDDTFSYITSLTRIRGDRFFAHVRRDLRDEVKNSILSNLFHEITTLGHTPPPGYQKAGSFKTLDTYGNLQLTFFSKIDSVEFMIDADIDDAQGIEYIFQVVGHALTGEETHPYDIHEILLRHQKLDPGYEFIV
jgi:hypothetical protein